MEPPLGLRTIALVTAVACLPGINYLGMLIQNGAALLLPAWVHLGSGRPGGVEALGQNMLIIVAYSALLSVGLALPGMFALLVFALLRHAVGWWALVPAVAVLLGCVAVEAAALLRWLGGVFESTDPVAAEIAA
jgi:hypothetical protein